MSKKQWKFCLLNTFFVFLLFLILQKSHILPGENNKIFFMGPFLKNLVASEDSSKSAKRFLFINTTYDKKLVNHLLNVSGGPVSEGVTRGNIAITDREKLTRLFEKISTEANYNYLVCNILFDHPSDDNEDAALLSVMKQLPKSLIAKGEKVQNLLPGFQNLNLGLDVIYTPGGTFSKYRLFDKGKTGVEKSIPLKVYEEVYDTKIQPYWFFSNLKGGFIFNDFIPDNEITKTDSLVVIDLGDIARYPESDIADMTKDNIVIIGGFYNNDKKTIYDQNTPAPLILANTYLAMEKGGHRLSFGLITTLLLVFFFFSYLVISKQSKVESKVFKLPLLGGLIGGTTYAIAMSLVSLFLYLVFNANINLVYLGIFFYVENIVINRHFHYLRIKKRFNIGKASKN